MHLTAAGRYNRTTVENRDGIRPGGVDGSLDGSHVFSRLNPAVGVTVNASRAVNLYAGYNEGSRAATSIELGCADPERPCKLPNAMAGDPPLAQVVTRTLDTGVRGQAGPLAWNAGYFRAANRDDILFVQSDQTGFGYFKNFGRTMREGLELGARGRAGRAEVGAGYTYSVRDLSERRAGQRGEQQQQRRGRRRRPGTRRRDRRSSRAIPSR